MQKLGSSQPATRFAEFNAAFWKGFLSKTDSLWSILPLFTDPRGEEDYMVLQAPCCCKRTTWATHEDGVCCGKMSPTVSNLGCHKYSKKQKPRIHIIICQLIRLLLCITVYLFNHHGNVLSKYSCIGRKRNRYKGVLHMLEDANRGEELHGVVAPCSFKIQQLHKRSLFSTCLRYENVIMVRKLAQCKKVAGFLEAS